MITTPLTSVSAIIEGLCASAKLDVNQAKKAIYWRIASINIKQMQTFPGLAIVGPSGSGKSTIIDALKAMDESSAVSFSCIRLSTPETRDKLGDAYEKTAFCEEFDQLNDPSSAYTFFHSRTERALSTIALKQQKFTNGPFERTEVNVFGATVVHSRNELIDPAIVSRFLTITTTHRSPPYPPFLANCNEIAALATSISVSTELSVNGRIESTWWPVLHVAKSLGDNEWIAWAEAQIAFHQEGLLEAAAYDRKAVILGRVIELLADQEPWDRTLGWHRLNVSTDVSEYLRRNGYPDINAWQVASDIRTLGLKMARSGGRNWIYPTPVLLLLACEKTSYQDEWVEDLKTRLES